jgi:RNA recognition motif-containing protein
MQTIAKVFQTSAKHLSLGPNFGIRKRGEDGVTKTLYVGNLPWSTTKEDLAAFFADFTEVKASRVIIDPISGRSKGFGFIEVEDQDVERVIDAANGKDMGGREIIVNEAKPRQPKM